MEHEILGNDEQPPVWPQRAIVLAPHPDDEVFGCGGTLHLMAKAGTRIGIVVLTDGRCGGDAQDAEALAEMRRRESLHAASILGLPAPEFWQLSDRSLRYSEALVTRIVQVIKNFGAEWVFSPGLGEVHPDHQVTALATAEAVRRAGGHLTLLCYEVSTALYPNRLVDITSVLAIKNAAMECFHSQNRVQAYHQRILHLNRYRAYALGNEAEAAEAFLVLHPDDLARGPADVPWHWSQRRLRLAAVLDAGQLPLVSVIVRSMNRPTLPEALESVAAQTYAPIEVIVVNATGRPHRPVDAWEPRLRCRLLDRGMPLSRSRAANEGLCSATGEYVLFLDEDDVLLPNHVEKLLVALRNDDSKRRAAYSGVSVEDRQGRRQFDYDEPWSQGRLLAANYIPIMAVLFERTLVEDGCRFDESLQLLEDWDFWLQLSEKTSFLHVPGISAHYRYGLGLSGLSNARDEQTYRRWRAVVLDKWIKRLGPQRLDEALYELSQRLHHTHAVLTELRKEAAALRDTVQRVECMKEEAFQKMEAQRVSMEMQEQRLYEVGCRLSEMERLLKAQSAALEKSSARLQAMESSTIWKLSRPLREMKTRLMTHKKKMA